MICPVKLILLSLWLSELQGGEGARILGLFPADTKSHHNFIQPVLRAVHGAGHEVLIYSPFPSCSSWTTTNCTDVYLERKLTDVNIRHRIMGSSRRPYWKKIDGLFEHGDLIFEDLFKNEKFKQLLTSKEKIDLVITEAFAGQEFTLILGHIFKSPVIVLRSSVTYWIVDVNSGNIPSMSYIPDVCSPYSDKMSLFERMYNSFSILRDMPPLMEMIDNVALTFTNSHLASDYAQPFTPNIVHVGGIDIKQGNPIPQDIQTFMDEAPEGVILFSLGTNILDAWQPKEFFDTFISVFKQLPQRILWKTDRGKDFDLPENVLAAKWFPQQDVLGHANCVLFITHGGKHSQHEAIHQGVPVVGIPYFLDQTRNVGFFEERGLGVKLDPNHLSEKVILTAIRTVIYNPWYKDNMKRQSQLFRDRPVSPADSVVFWTEYVLRHDGAPHLRPASSHLNFYQLILMDVLFFIFLVFCVLIVVMYFMFKTLLYSVRNLSK